MYLCIYVSMYLCIYVSMYHACMHACMSVCLYVCNSVTPSKRRLAIRALTDLLFQLQTPVMGSLGSQILDDFSRCLVLTCINHLSI